MSKRIFKYILVAAAAAVTLFALLLAVGVIILFAQFEYKNEVYVVIQSMFFWMLAAFLVSLLCTGFIALVLSKKLLRPVYEMDIESPSLNNGYSELEPLVHRINRQNKLINMQMSDLKRKQEEFKTITENMSEGFVLIDTNGEILSYNESSTNILGIENGSVTLSDLKKNELFRQVAKDALSGRHSERICRTGNKTYQVLANPVVLENEICGAVMVTLDVTEKEEREVMRREFTSNVSHELKTPLTSIYGVSEMIMSGIVKPEDVNKFAKSIHDESGRLISLVNDIIRLSQLDENPSAPQKEKLNLADVAESVRMRIERVAVKHGLTMECALEPAEIYGIATIIDEMIYNLADNAIKYNKEGGYIRVETGVRDGKPFVMVKDNGIGISKEHHDRVFERFYCVDKSRSKAIGGTGLGLSIVKHAANLHDATIRLVSIPGEGTEITVVFYMDLT